MFIANLTMNETLLQVYFSPVTKGGTQMRNTSTQTPTEIIGKGGCTSSLRSDRPKIQYSKKIYEKVAHLKFPGQRG